MASPSGGTITTNGNKTVHTFNSNDDFVIPAGKSGNIEVLIVGGGGGGGRSDGASGAGAGGGVVHISAHAITAGTYPVVIGAGGAKINSGTSQGNNGDDSTFDGLTAKGGGGGGGGTGSGQTGKDGGSGGGGCYGSGAGGSEIQSDETGDSGTYGHGYDGGTGGPQSDAHGSGGGGGAGEAGANGTASVGGDGGDGYQTDISGSSTYYAGGGGGGVQTDSYTGGTGGLGGGGNGDHADGNAGTANTGGGGSGGGPNGSGYSGGAGGSGVVIISYVTEDFSDGNIEEIITITDDWTITEYKSTEYASNVIYDSNHLYYVTNTNPAELIDVDITTPSSPSKTIYTLTGYSYAKDVTLNSSNGYLYVSCANGKVLKIEKANLNNVTEIDTSDTDTFIHTDALDTFLKTFATTNDSSGEIITIDEATMESINADVRWASETTESILCRVNTVLCESLNCDVRFAKETTAGLKTDIRWLKYSYADASNYPIDYGDIQVKINGTDLAPIDDVDLKSVNISHNKETKTIATFNLHRRHDNPDYDNQGNSSEISNQNAVKIYLNGNLEFDGTVRKIRGVSQGEYINVTAEMNEPSSKKNTVEIPLSSLNSQLNIYDCLVDDIDIDNPTLDSKAVISNENGLYWTGTEWTGNIDDAQEFASHTAAQSYIDGHSVLSTYTSQEVFPTNHDLAPELYNGIQVNLGTQIKQSIFRFSVLFDAGLDEELENGTFEPRQNFDYFWFASFENWALRTARSPVVYLGTSLGSLSTDTWKINSATYKYQKRRDDIETDLGLYYLGSAPYKEISPQNGRLITKDRWEDGNDGLYRVKDEAYDYRQYARDVADLEYDKLKNINGDVTPITSATIELTLDAYYYYGISLLTRINLSNTTTEDVYNGNNGFPVAVKSININTGSMRVTLACDNQLSAEEMDEIDDNKPDINSDEYIQEAEEVRNYRKFDPNRWGYLE